MLDGQNILIKNTIIYIHLNTVKANMVKKPENY